MLQFLPIMLWTGVYGNYGMAGTAMTTVVFWWLFLCTAFLEWHVFHIYKTFKSLYIGS